MSELYDHQFPGYRQVESLYQSDRTGVYRAYSKDLGHEVLLKVCHVEAPPVDLVESYKNEYQRAQQFQQPGLLKAYKYTQFGDRPALVLEAFFGQSLAEKIPQAPLDLKSFFSVARAITQTLATIHQQGWIHRDVKPGNILINDEGEIRLIDYALMTPLHSRLRQEHLVGTLGYLPPEQTGRVNRLTDQRSDLYALGVSFFEMLTQEMPLQADNDLSLIHAHLALEPRKLEDLQPHMPKPLCEMITKLLKKDPGERYQSARGLLHDLTAIEKIYLEDGDLKSFKIATQDVSETLRHTAGLYSRKNILDELISMTQACQKTQKSQSCLVVGEPGVGKSYLISELKRLQVGAQLFKVRAQREKCHRPFQALLDLLSLYIEEGRASGREWQDSFKQELQNQMAPHLSSLCDLIPALSRLWPGQQNNEKHENSERIAQQLTELTAIIIAKTPLIFVIEDIHFCDKETQFIIDKLIADGKGKCLLIGISEPGQQDKIYLESSSRNLSFLPLSREDIKDYLSLACDQDAPEKIEQIFYEKTGGNLYALEQLIDQINRNQWATRSDNGSWVWDTHAVEQLNVSDNMASLLVEKLHQVSPENLMCLQAASCLGYEFKTTDLKELLAWTDQVFLENFYQVTQTGLIHGVDDNKYSFSHENIRQSLTETMSDSERERYHYKIAKKRLTQTSIYDLSRNLRQSLADQVIAAQSLFSDEAEQAAEVCYQAAESLFRMAAFEKSLYYTQKGLEFCDSGQRETKNRLTHNQAECLFRMGEISQAESLIDELLKKSMSVVERARLLLIACFVYQAQGDFQRVMKTGLEAMALIGAGAPLKPNGLHLIKAIIKTERYRKKLAKGQVRPQPWEHTLLSHELRAAIGKAAYFSNKKLYALMSIQGAYESLSTGHEMPTALTPYAVILSGKLGRYHEGSELVRKAFEKSDQKQKTTSAFYSEHLHKVIYRIFIRVWMVPLSELVEDLKNLYNGSRKLGDPMSISTSALYLGAYQLQQGFPLFSNEENLKDYKEFIHYHKDQVLIDDFESVELFYQALRGGTLDHKFEIDGGRSEENFVSYLNQHISPNPAAFYGYHKLQYSHLLGLETEAEKALPLAKKCEEAIPFSLGFAVYLFYRSLHSLSRWQKMSFWQRLKSRFFIRKAIRKFQLWAELEPTTYEPYLRLIEAELARVRRLSETYTLSLFEKAFAGAKNTGHLILQGLAFEKAADFSMSRGVTSLAKSYFEKSLTAYEIWGSPVKVEQLKRKYPELIPSRHKSSSPSRSSLSKNSTLMGHSLDLEAIMKASQAIASEIEMAPLSARLVQALVESAGATHGALFMLQSDDLRLLSDCSFSPDNQHCVVNVRNVKNREKDMPMEFVRRVLNHGSLEVLENTQDVECFHNCNSNIRWRSVLCLPIQTSRGFTGVALLNNDKADGFFTQDHVETLKVLSSQATISIQNAQLHEETKEKMRMQGELETASQVQSTLMPPTEFESDQVLIQGSYQPASECGGDWWYYHQIGDKLILCIGDATGHGVSAALITSAVRSGIKVMEDFPDLAVNDILSRLNNVIHLSTRGDVLMTFFMASVDLNTGMMEYCNASHTSPYYIRDGQVECLLCDPSPILGRQHNAEYTLSQHIVEPGDNIIFFTDGLTELHNPEGRMWGEQALVRLMRKLSRQGDEEQLLSEIQKASHQFQKEAPLADDVTYFTVQLKGLVRRVKGAA